MLGAMSIDELMKFYDETRKHPRKAAWALFGNKPGSTAACRDLANLAANLAAQMACLLEGKSNEAQKYKDICQRIIDDLPAYAVSMAQ